jgi:hypothetical protein|tara:strand:+ start:400 stop:543 length:144 start_codon:yes stop_codon:yes gene_type:complete
LQFADENEKQAHEDFYIYAEKYIGHCKGMAAFDRIEGGWFLSVTYYI